MVNNAVEIKVRAERRAGEMLKEGAKNGDRVRNGGDRKSELQRETLIRPPKLAEIGVSKMQSHRWQAIAAIPETN